MVRADDLCLVKAIDRLGQSVVVAVATLSTEGSVPAAARCSVYFMDTYPLMNEWRKLRRVYRFVNVTLWVARASGRDG